MYCSYNMILLIPMLISLRKHIKNSQSIKYISIFSGIIIFILSFIIFSLLIKCDVEISNLELPIVYIVRMQLPNFHKMYAFIILSSIFTTAISIGVGLLQNLNKKRFNYPQLVSILCITGLIFSNFGFSNLINIAYPIFGFLGMIQLFLIMKEKT